MADEIVFVDSEIIVDDDGKDAPVGKLVNVTGKPRVAKADSKAPAVAADKQVKAESPTKKGTEKAADTKPAKVATKEAATEEVAKPAKKANPTETEGIAKPVKETKQAKTEEPKPAKEAKQTKTEPVAVEAENKPANARTRKAAVTVVNENASAPSDNAHIRTSIKKLSSQSTAQKALGRTSFAIDYNDTNNDKKPVKKKPAQPKETNHDPWAVASLNHTGKKAKSKNTDDAYTDSVKSADGKKSTKATAQLPSQDSKTTKSKNQTAKSAVTKNNNSTTEEKNMATATTKTEKKSTAKAETKPTAKAAAKVETKPAAKTTAKVEAKPAPAAKTAAKAETKPAAKAATKAEAKPVAKAEAKPATKTETKPAAKTEAKPATKPEVKPAAKAEAKPAAKPVAKAQEPAEKVIVEGDATTNHGKFVIKRTDNDNFVFKLFSSNKRVVAVATDKYTSIGACKNGIQSIINNAANAPIEDQTLRKVVVQKCPKWVIFEDARGEFRLRLIASNGEMVTQTNDGYLSKDAAKKGIEAIARAAKGADIVRNDDLW